MIKNSRHTKLAIGILINDEPDINAKLELLTCIGIQSHNKEVFGICENIREYIIQKDAIEKNKEVKGAK